MQGPIKVTVQELDGSFNHMLQIEENSLKHDIPCHSKSRRYVQDQSPFHVCSMQYYIAFLISFIVETFITVVVTTYHFILSQMLFPIVSFPRNKKKKIPLMNGEEVDMDLSAME